MIKIVLALLLIAVIIAAAHWNVVCNRDTVRT